MRDQLQHELRGIERSLSRPGLSNPLRRALREHADELRRADASFEGFRAYFEREHVGHPLDLHGVALARAFYGGYDAAAAGDYYQCPECDGWFAPSRQDQTCCSPRCRKRRWRRWQEPVRRPAAG